MNYTCSSNASQLVLPDHRLFLRFSVKQAADFYLLLFLRKGKKKPAFDFAEIHQVNLEIQSQFLHNIMLNQLQEISH